MSIFLQIAIGFIPALLIFAILAVFQKNGRMFHLIGGAVFLVAGLTLTGVHFLCSPTVGMTVETSKAQLGLIYAVAYEDDGQEVAETLLDTMREQGGDTGEITLCDALLHAFKGDYVGAKALYLKADTLLNLSDDTLVSLCDAAFAESANAAGTALEQLQKYASKQIKSSIPEDIYSTTAKALITSEQIFDAYISDNSMDEDAIRTNLRRLGKNLEEYPEIAAVAQVRLSRIKLQILLGNYKETAQYITADATYDELAIVSELYMAGIVKETSFAPEYGTDFKIQAEAVCAQLEKVIDNFSSEQITLRKSAKAIVNELKKASSTPAIYRMKDAISQIAADITSPDRSKAYLQLAKFEYHDGDTDAAESYITSSLETVGMSDDDNYFVPMSNLVEIVTDADDPEKLKDIATYVEEVTTHSSDEMVIKALTENPVDDEPADEGEEKQSFDSLMTDTLNQTRISLDITHVDSSNFDTVTVTVNISDTLAQNATELKELIKLTDCGVEITDFTVEKVEFTASNILLCCDVSGSMSGQPINDLKNAVIKFLETSPEKENVALVTFSSSVEDVYGFDTDPQKILDAAQAIYSGGGTNMYGAIIRALNEFSNDPNVVNYILLLSDGQDGGYHDIEDMQIDIGDPAKNAGIILYSLGLGSGVDIEYMSNLATVTGGDFMHVVDSESLATFYEKLRNQAMNRYKITFKAQDTMAVNRTVHIAHKDKPMIVSDSYVYRLGSEVESDEATEYNYVGMNGKTITGLSTGLLYKSPLETTIQAIGEGFTQDDTFGVKLDGALDYDSVACSFVNNTTLNIVIPGGIACGTYDVRITINGKTAVLIDALHIVTQGSEKTTKFGPYVFTSYSKVENGLTTTLSDYVVMNGWLSFNGDVTLNGDLTAQSVHLIDYEGCYIRYNVSTATGFAATLADRGEVLELGSLGTVELFNVSDVSPTSDDYPVNETSIPELFIPNLMWSKMPSMKLYPHKLLIDMTGFNTDLPLQDVLVKDTNKKLFEFELEGELTVSNTQLGTKIEAGLGTNPKDGKTMTTVGKMSIPVYKGNINVVIDTIENLFSIDMGVEIPALFKGNDTGLGLKLEWKAREGNQGFQKLCPSVVQFKVDYPIKTNIGGVPITLDDFKLALENIDPNGSILDCHFIGSMDIGLSKVSDYLPGLDKKIGDVSLLKLDDTTLELAWNDCYIGLKTEMKFLNEITLGKFSIEAGRLPFTVALLNIYDIENYGMRASSTQGIIWDTDNCDVDISGTGTLSVNPTLFAMEYSGKAEIDIKWWIFSKRFYESGDAVVAFYTDQKGLFNFAIIAEHNGFFGTKQYYLTWNKETDLKVGSKRV